MMIKIGSDYLEYNDTIEVERQAKLLEDLSTTNGDYSYQFDAPWTSKNFELLGRPLPDNIRKLTYQKIDCDLVSDDGIALYKGYLRIEGLSGYKIQLSFFSGNNNWFGLLSEGMRAIDWSEFDVDQTEMNISGAILSTSGTVFPYLDNGLLAYRGAAVLKVEDFVGAIYLKDIVKKIFQTHSIKTQGDLFDDADFNSAIVLSNGKSQEDIEARSAKVLTTSSANPSDAAYHVMTWTDDSTYPYFDGAANLFDLANNRYVADVKMKVKVDLNITQNLSNTIIGGTYFKMAFFVNSVLYSEQIAPFGNSTAQSFSDTVILEAGDILEIETYNNAPIWDDPITFATLDIKPIFIYKAIGSAMVPDWTQSDFIANVFKQFNVISEYDAQTMTLTADLFEKLKSKSPVDLSPYVSNVETDYIDFISGYGKRSLFQHQPTEQEEDFRKLNFTLRSSGPGTIEVDNEFLEDEETIIDSEFSEPITYLNPIFAQSIEKTNLLEVEEETTIDFTGVIDSPGTSGRARFAIPEDVFELADLVRVRNSTNPSYNGDWIVITLGTGYIELEGLAFDTDAIGEVTKLNIIYSSSDQVYLLHHLPLYPVSNFSGKTSIQIENTDYETLAPAFYSLIDTGRRIDEEFPFSMSFKSGDQKSVLDKNFGLATRCLNDPVKLLVTALIPYKVYLQLSFLRPVTLTSLESSNMYYLNRQTGYEGKYCLLELIKLP